MIRSTILLAATAFTAVAQTKAGTVPPREIDKAARKVDQGWKAWQQARPENNLLGRPKQEALDEIDRSDERAQKYLDSKRAYYGLIAKAYRAQAESLLEQLTDDPAAGAGVRREQVKRLNEQASQARRELERLSKNSSDPRVSSLRMSYTNQIAAIEKLQAEAQQQAARLDEASKTAASSDEARLGMARSLRNVAEAVDHLSDVAAMELDHWKAYHRELRALVGANSTNRNPSVDTGSRTSFQQELDAIQNKEKLP